MIIRLAKIVTGEFVIGLNDEERDGIKDVTAININNVNEQLSINLLPLGSPFDDNLSCFIPNSEIVYEVNKIPKELEVGYANIKVAKNKQLINSVILAYLLQEDNHELTVEYIAKALNLNSELTLAFLDELVNAQLITITDDVVKLTDMGIKEAEKVTYTN